MIDLSTTSTLQMFHGLYHNETICFFETQTLGVPAEGKLAFASGPDKVKVVYVLQFRWSQGAANKEDPLRLPQCDNIHFLITTVAYTLLNKENQKLYWCLTGLYSNWI